MVLFAPMLVIGLLSFVGALRFSMYLAPFLGMGLGYLLYVGFWLIDKFLPRFRSGPVRKIAYISVSLILVLVSIPWAPLTKLRTPPKITVGVTEGLVKLQTLTPEDAYVWTWWDYGYAVRYLADREVFHHGGNWRYKLTTFVAKSFVNPNPEEVFNIINGISHLMQEGVDKEVERLGAVEFERRLLSGNYTQEFKFPVYFVFTNDLIYKYGSIHFIGSWDFELKQGVSKGINPLIRCGPIGNNVYRCAQGIVDLNRAIFSPRPGVGIPIKRLVIRTADGKVNTLDFRNAGLSLVIIQVGKYKFRYLVDEDVFSSSFFQMYILRNYDARFFELVYDDFPHVVAYRVKTLKEIMKSE
jgi:dolichyl-diphosphooligosaccharide--protein glycosyltransferase